MDPEKLTSPLKLESPEVDKPEFPHLCGPLNFDAVLQVLPFHEGPDGYELPAELVDAKRDIVRRG